MHAVNQASATLLGPGQHLPCEVRGVTR